MGKYNCERGCLTCVYAEFEKETLSGCKFPVPIKMPRSWKYSAPSMTGTIDESSTEYSYIPGTERAYICHDEYYDEAPVVDCPCWELRGRRAKTPKSKGVEG